MSERYDYGPLDTYEVIWTSGHVERVQAHQVCMPMPDALSIFSEGVGPREQRWTFHGEFEGRWKLILTAQAEDIKSVRNVTQTADDLGGMPWLCCGSTEHGHAEGCERAS